MWSFIDVDNIEKHKMIKDKFKNCRIILATNSPRRKELFSSLDIPFKIFTKEIDESYPKEISPLAVAEFLAVKKANAYSAKEKELIITSDTIVIHKDIILNKPKDYSQAYQMLSLISNSSNNVITGVCIKSKNKQISFSETSKVYFSKLDEEEIQFYIKNYNPLDKAGAYGIQDWIGKIGIKNINGCYYNVMGLPIHKLYQELKKF